MASELYILSILILTVSTVYGSGDAAKADLDSTLSATGNLSNRVEKILQVVEYLKQNSIETKAKMYELHGLCPVRYDNKCFFAVFDYILKPDLDISNVLCKEKGAKMANIYSEEHMVALANYIRPYLALRKGERIYIAVHTGMKFNPTTGIITLTDGTQSGLNQWLPAYPKYEPGRTTICFETLILGYSPELGIYDSPASHGYEGALCEINLE